MKKIVLPILLTFISVFSVYSQKLIAYRDSVPDSYNFWVYVPETYDSVSATTPMILFLHGQSLCGTNLANVRRYGPLDALRRGRKIDAVIVAPQSPGPPWNPEKIWEVVEWAKERYPVDTNRFYVIGMSKGGYGTLDFSSVYYDKIAAAMALCGGSNAKSYCGLNTIPLRIMHGTADRAVGISQSQKVINQMKACGDTPLLIFDKLSGQNHSQLAKIFYLPETYEWLFSHSRSDSVRQVNRNIPITPATMQHAYENFSTGKLIVIDPLTTASANTNASIDTLNTQKTVNQSNTISNNNASNSSHYHVIRKGETLSYVARKYHTTVEKLCKKNHLKETSILQIGQKIYY